MGSANQEARAPVVYTVACNRDSTPLLDVLSAEVAAGLQFKRHYEVVQSDGYVCFVPLISTYCLLPEVMAAVDSNFHILELIQPHIRAAAAEGRCLICLDASSEGDPYLPTAYEHLHRWLAEHGIPQSSVVLLSQNRMLGPIYQAQTGGEIVFLQHDFYIKKFLRHFGADTDAFSAQFGFAPDQIVVDLEAPKAHAFLCMNGAPRPNRILAMAAFQSAGLLPRMQWSMLGDQAGKLSPSLAHARELRDIIGARWIEDAAFDGIMHATPRFLAGEEGGIARLTDSNALADTVNLGAFASSFASVVTETEYSGGDVRRVTEKTIRAFAMGHPTVVVGNPGSLELMREIGFRTFSDVFDESYDELADGEGRLSKIIETLRQIEAVMQDPAQVARLSEICRANFEFARTRAVQAYEANVEQKCLDGLYERLARLGAAEV